jgi:hypothetical protein
VAPSFGVGIYTFVVAIAHEYSDTVTPGLR